MLNAEMNLCFTVIRVIIKSLCNQGSNLWCNQRHQQNKMNVWEPPRHTNTQILIFPWRLWLFDFLETQPDPSISCHFYLYLYLYFKNILKRPMSNAQIHTSQLSSCPCHFQQTQLSPRNHFWLRFTNFS